MGFVDAHCLSLSFNRTRENHLPSPLRKASREAAVTVGALGPNAPSRRPWAQHFLGYAPYDNTEGQGERQASTNHCDHRKRSALRQLADQKGAEGGHHHLQE